MYRSHAYTPNTTVSLALVPRQIAMGKVNANGGSLKPKPTPCEEAMDALSSLISERFRATSRDKDLEFDLMFYYLRILDLEESITRMKIIHVAGTKGKGSTCCFAESILRNCGFHTGLFITPLLDVKERFLLDGVEICEEKLAAYIMWCFNRLKEKATEDFPMPPYFRFLVLLAFKIFAEEQVDVAILEVGLGGKLDSTNVVQEPVVCGITSLGYDHMEILGNTLGEIAEHKAGILKHGAPAFTVPQPEEAMRVIEDKASQLDVPLQVVQPLDASSLKGLRLGLEGQHQYQNAGLAVALCSSWLRRIGHVGILPLEHTNALPAQFIKGLTTTRLEGRCQIIPDRSFGIKSTGNLVFYLDGAHTPESMDVCARWFSDSVKEDEQQVLCRPPDNSRYLDDEARNKSLQILVFYCLPPRDPHALLSHLMETCASHGVHFKKALFVAKTSLRVKGGPRYSPPSEADLPWQFTMQRVWENLMQKNKGGGDKTANIFGKDLKDDGQMFGKSGESSAGFLSLPVAIKWLRESAQQNPSLHFQVLVTGCVSIVADMLALVRSEKSCPVETLNVGIENGRKN